MDFMIELVNVSEENYQKYVAAIDNSNLEKVIKWDLKELLQTARTQTEQGKKMGWL